MNVEDLNIELKKSYNRRFKSVSKRVKSSLRHLENEKGLVLNDLELTQMRSLVTTMLNVETKSLQEDVETLLQQKELVERSLEKKYLELQDSKYDVFDVLEEDFVGEESALLKLHQVKLQSIDLYDILSEMVESAIIHALEKDDEGDIKDTILEIVKGITYEAIKEGSLNTVRVRKILSTVLATAIDIAEASPNKANNILSGTLRGMRSGLVHSIDRFKKRLANTPVEVKHILVEDYDIIVEDLHQTDTIFTQVVENQASQSSENTKTILTNTNKEMRYDLEDLLHISKEAAEVMKEKFSSLKSSAVKTTDSEYISQKAQEAKKMGIEAWGVAKSTLENVIKTAKTAIDKKEK